MIYNASDIILTALRIEKNGFNFYNHAQKKIEEVNIKNLLIELAKEEQRHADYFQTIEAELKKKQIISYEFDTEIIINYLADSHVFNKENMGEKLGNSINNAKEALDIALTFEKDTISFFTELGHNLEGEARNVINKIIDEERNHIKKIVLMKKELNL
ncbi:MAG: hypothetical protein A2X12_01270 [Bacteroidetes bacterium GWE2_29_8]|nr:MAG: hypothetical protein A2X12_01270 [Bacteroidetes bacterium GWE2_29_8]OFY21757.1 MAG: hypothetical protein A2X02_00315 [Bacteroidetes bacterium GWF2_29_10]